MNRRWELAVGALVFVAVTAGKLKVFLDAGDHNGPGCILLDVRLPGISGLDFQSRRDGFGIHLPIVLMTGHGDVPMSVRAMKGGAIDFLAKPFRDQDLLDAVFAAIERDRQQRTADEDLGQIRQRFSTLSPREREQLLDMLIRVIQANAIYARPGAGRRKRGSRRAAIGKG